MFLILSGLCAQPRRCLGDLLMPTLDAPLGQLVECQGAEFGNDPRVGCGLGAVDRLTAATLVVREIVNNRLGYGVWVVERHEVACRFPRFRLEPVTCLCLRIPEVKHGQPVDVECVVGSAERFETTRPILVAKFGDPGSALGAAAIA